MPSLDTSRYPRDDVDEAAYNTVRRPGKTDLERAIEFAKEHREIHLQYIDFLRTNPPKTQAQRLVRRSAGGIRHQEVAVRRYDVILRALEANAA